MHMSTAGGNDIISIHFEGIDTYGTVFINDHQAGQCENSRFVTETQAMFVAGKAQISIPEPMLWYPLGYGDQNLYTLTFELLHHDVVVDTRVEQFGIRTVVIEKSYRPNDAGEFKFVVNGVPVMVKGTNRVFLDCLHSLDIARLPQAHALWRSI